MRSQTSAPKPRAAPTFASIVCGINGSRPSFEAARQAALLADPGAGVTYVAVSWEQGTGANAQATLSHAHARDCLRRARDEARELGVDPGIIAENAENPTRRLMELAAGQDLLVVGIAGHSRAGGIIIGSTATALVHRSPLPVLVARRPPEGVEFPSRILLASDGTPRSDAATTLTARIAARHRAHVAIVGARDHDLPFQPGLDEHATQIIAATGVEPLVLQAPGPPDRAVADAARNFDASLVVTGCRSLTGLPALRSAS